MWRLLGYDRFTPQVSVFSPDFHGCYHQHRYDVYITGVQNEFVLINPVILNSNREKTMNPSKLFRTLFMLCGIVLLMAHETVHADYYTADPTASTPKLVVKKNPVYTLCPDLKANLTLTKSSNGLVTISGTVTNVGVGNYNMASVAEVIMNLAYAPQYSCVQTGVSDILKTMTFSTLKRGASFTVNTAYQIPDFGGWASESVQGNAKRYFTLRVIKQDMTSYQSGEDCNPENNSALKEVAYRDLMH